MSPFSIGNDGIFPIWNVEMRMYTGSVLAKPYETCVGGRIEGAYGFFGDVFDGPLKRDEEQPFYGKGYSVGFGGKPLPTIFATTLVDVTYSTLWVPWRRTESFVFGTFQTENDFMWTASPDTRAETLRDTSGNAFAGAITEVFRTDLPKEYQSPSPPCESDTVN